MSVADWLHIVDVSALVFAVGVYGFLSWRAWRSGRVVPALLDATLALIFAAAAFASGRRLFGVVSPWLGQVLFSAIIALPALRSLHLWIEARRFISAAEGVLDDG